MAGRNGLFVTPAPATTPTLAATPAAAAAAAAPTPTPAPTVASIDLTGDEDHIYIPIPDEGILPVLPSELLDTVKGRGIDILKTAAKNCRNQKLKEILKDRTDNVQLSNTTAKMVNRYERSWSKELKQARKLLSEEVVALRKVLEKQLPREWHVAKFQEEIVGPMEELLEDADHDIAVFNCLIEFLKRRAGI